MVKLKMFTGSLLCVTDHSDLRFSKECLRRNYIMNPCNYNWV